MGKAAQTVAKALALILFQLGQIFCFQQHFFFFIPELLAESICALRATFSTADHKF